MQIGRFTPSAYEKIAAASSTVAAITPPVPSLAAMRPPVTDQDEGTIVGTVPPAPTDEAREMVDRAAEVVTSLREHNRELHFTRDDATNRVVIEVRDLEGNVIKTIPPAKALDIMSGAEL